MTVISRAAGSGSGEQRDAASSAQTLATKSVPPPSPALLFGSALNLSNDTAAAHEPAADEPAAHEPAAHIAVMDKAAAHAAVVDDAAADVALATAGHCFCGASFSRKSACC